MKCLLVKTLFLLLTPIILKSQHQQRGLLVYNVSCGAIVGGVGSIINKPKGEDWKKALVRGLWQGSVGGSLNFCGKKLLYHISRDETLAYACPAKLVHDAGTSIVESAAANKPFLKYWHTNIGFVRVDLSSDVSQKVRVRFLPMVIPAVIGGFMSGRWDIPASLATGNLCFSTKGRLIRSWGGLETNGVSFGRSISYVNNPSYTNNRSNMHYIIAHELVHQFQFDEYQSFNSWLIPVSQKVKSEKAKTLFSKYIYFDVPYLWIGYAIEGNHGYSNYFRNYYELEAESFATNRHVR